MIRVEALSVGCVALADVAPTHHHDDDEHAQEDHPQNHEDDQELRRTEVTYQQRGHRPAHYAPHEVSRRPIRHGEPETGARSLGSIGGAAGRYVGRWYCLSRDGGREERLLGLCDMPQDIEEGSDSDEGTPTALLAEAFSAPGTH